MLVNKPQTKHKAWVANPKSRRYCKSPPKRRCRLCHRRKAAAESHKHVLVNLFLNRALASLNRPTRGSDTTKRSRMTRNSRSAARTAVTYVSRKKVCGCMLRLCVRASPMLAVLCFCCTCTGCAIISDAYGFPQVKKECCPATASYRLFPLLPVIK